MTGMTAEEVEEQEKARRSEIEQGETGQDKTTSVVAEKEIAEIS